MPLAIWMGAWDEKPIELEVEVFGQFQQPRQRRKKLGRFHYRYRLFADCNCLCEEVRDGQIEDLVVLRGRLRRAEETVPVRATLRWISEEPSPEDPLANAVFGHTLRCDVRVGEQSIELKQIGNKRPRRDIEPSEDEPS